MQSRLSPTLRSVALHGAGLALVSLLLAMAVLREVPCIYTNCCGEHRWLSPLMGPGFYTLALLAALLLAGIGLRVRRGAAPPHGHHAAGPWLLLCGQFLVAVGFAGADNVIAVLHPMQNGRDTAAFCAVDGAPPPVPLVQRLEQGR